MTEHKYLLGITCHSQTITTMELLRLFLKVGNNIVAMSKTSHLIIYFVANEKKKKKSGNSVAKKTWGKVVGGPLWYGENIQKERGVYGANPGVFGRPSRRMYAYDRQQREVEVCGII